MRYLALGDSYTIGTCVEASESFPQQLAERLRREGIPTDDPLILARNGWSTDELLAGIASARLRGNFELVSLLIGVNDQYRGRSVEEYEIQFRQLLDRAIPLAQGDPKRVVVLSIPDYGLTPFAAHKDTAAVAAEIDAYNATNGRISKMAGTRYADITSLTRRLGSHPDLLAEDGLHPSGKMYAAWVEVLLPVARRILQPAG